jgi:hypothetical protein
MTAASDRKTRRRKRRRWQNRGGGGMVRRRDRHTSGGTKRVRTGGKGALQKVSPFWQTVIGLVTLGIAASAVFLVVYGIFFA